MKILALWCHPRSVSTAFERLMRARGDVDIPHEPFMYHYYLTQKERMFPNFRPEPDHPTTYEGIRDMIRDRAQRNTVFFKDMAYYVVEELAKDPVFLSQMHHAFLVRDPKESILSYQRLDPDFTRTELGYEAQFRLYQALVDGGTHPLVITSDQLRNDPETTLTRYWEDAGLEFAPHAFSWDNSVPEAWKSVQEWHARTLSRQRIEPAEAKGDLSAQLDALGAPFTEYETFHRPFYETLKSVAESQAKTFQK